MIEGDSKMVMPVASMLMPTIRIEKDADHNMSCYDDNAHDDHDDDATTTTTMATKTTILMIVV